MGKHQCRITVDSPGFIVLRWDYWKARCSQHKAGTAPSPPGLQERSTSFPHEHGHWGYRENTIANCLSFSTVSRQTHLCGTRVIKKQNKTRHQARSGNSSLFSPLRAGSRTQFHTRYGNQSTTKSPPQLPPNIWFWNEVLQGAQRSPELTLLHPDDPPA